ncbi:hypothetical protein BGLA2_1720061 [Burkholderia gladioli]|nr:hypothetical protein BGLA2_1720061 [Burkholderia gladioli]
MSNKQLHHYCLQCLGRGDRGQGPRLSRLLWQWAQTRSPRPKNCFHPRARLLPVGRLRVA